MALAYAHHGDVRISKQIGSPYAFTTPANTLYTIILGRQALVDYVGCYDFLSQVESVLSVLVLCLSALIGAV